MREQQRFSDEELLDRFREGEAEAFEALIQRYETPLLRFAGNLLGGGVESPEDIVQDCFIRLIRQAREAGSQRAVGPWLFRVCRNLAYDAMKLEHRERQRRERVARKESDLSLAPQIEPERNELRERIDRELGNLPAKQREVIYLKVVEKRSYRQIAERTGLKPSYVGWLVRGAVRHLGERLRAGDLV